jgi:hypothetical protein
MNKNVEGLMKERKHGNERKMRKERKWGKNKGKKEKIMMKE